MIMINKTQITKYKIIKKIIQMINNNNFIKIIMILLKLKMNNKWIKNNQIKLIIFKILH